MGGGQATGEVRRQAVVDQEQEVCEHVAGGVAPDVASRALPFQALECGRTHLCHVVSPALSEVGIGPHPPRCLRLHAEPSGVLVDELAHRADQPIPADHLGRCQRVLFGQGEEQRVLVRKVVEDRPSGQPDLRLEQADGRAFVAMPREGATRPIEDAAAGLLEAICGHTRHPAIMQTVRSYCQGRSRRTKGLRATSTTPLRTAMTARQCARPAYRQGVELEEWVRQAKHVTVLTGAGISTDSGIPDFRGPTGLYNKDPDAQRVFELDAYVSDPQLRIRAWQGRANHPAWTAQPNPGHRALAALEHDGRLRALLTQNIDGLHQKAGSVNVLELHGTLFGVECLGCGDRTEMTAALERVQAGEQDPPCLICGGILKSATVSFGQQLDPEVIRAAHRASEECDLFLAVGTSLTVEPAASFCAVAVGNGARLVIVNADPTPYDDLASALVREPISTALPRLLTPATPTPT